MYTPNQRQRVKPKPKPRPEPPMNGDAEAEKEKEKEKEPVKVEPVYLPNGDDVDLDKHVPVDYDDDRGQPPESTPSQRYDHPETLEELSPKDLEKLQRLSENLKDPSREALPMQEQVALDYSATEEAAQILRMSEYSNILAVMGMQSSGKTSLYEAVMQLPLGYSCKGCATRARVLYRIRRRRGLKEPICSVHWPPAGEEVTGLSITEMNELVSRIMQGLRSIDLENTLTVTIEDSRVMTLTLIDLPGFLAREEFNEEGLCLRKEDITNLALKTLNEHRNAVQRILWVKNLETDKTLDNTVEVHKQVDPHFHRTIVAATHADVLKVTCRKQQELVNQLEQSWEGDRGSKTTQPWLLALHQIESDRKRTEPWHQLREEIKNQLKEQEHRVEEHLDDVQLPGNHVLREKLGWQAFAAHLQQQINEDFINNAGKIISQLEAKEKKIRRKAAELYGKINKDLLTESPVELARRGIMLLEATLNGLLDRESLDPLFIEEFGHTLEEEETLAVQYLGEHGIWIPLADKNFLDVPNAHKKLFTRAKGIRVAVMLNQKLHAVTVPEFNDNQYANAIQTTTDMDILHIPAGIGKLLFHADKEKLLPFIPYAVWRMAFVMHDLFKPAVALMKERGYEYIVDNQYFLQVLEESYQEWVEELANRCQDIITTFALSFWRYESWNLPCLLEGVDLGNRDPDGEVQVEDSKKGKNIVAEIGEEVLNATVGEKIRKIGGRLLEKMLPQETQEIGSVEQVKNQLARHFDAHKILLSTMINQAISGSILRATEPQKEARSSRADPRGPSLYEYLSKKLLSADMRVDPYCFSLAAKDLEARSSRMEKEADTIKDLCTTLRSHLATHRAYASSISLSG